MCLNSAVNVYPTNIIMKRKILAFTFTALILILFYITPLQWFMVKPQMAQEEVYKRCGLPASTDLWDIKGERWDDPGILCNWTMYVGFKNKRVTNSSIWLDFGKDDYSIRVYVSWNGRISLTCP